jgi:tRNA threonylcarbamoyladenosine biosynthesis protein TsaB
MATILNIETATSLCSVAISVNGKVIASQESNESNVHAEKLAIFIQSVLEKSKLSLPYLDAIAIGSGPGSYTGLRIGTSTAKGLCYGLNKPLIAVSTLKAMAATAIKQESKNMLYCPMIDARRMEVYTALYDNTEKEIVPVHAEIIDEHSFSEYTNKHTLAFFGDGMPKIKELFRSTPNMIWLDGIRASACNMAGLAKDLFNKKEFNDLAYYEPFYLKDFIAKKPANKGI